MSIIRAKWVLLTAALVACSPAATGFPTLAPDAGKRAAGTRGAVTSAHPAASEAGLAMLQQGGNAVDAAVAAAFAIGVVEPEMSGVGGSGSMLVWNQRERAADYVDFYASQPARAWNRAGVDSAAPLRTTAVPGLVAGLLEAHERYGKLTRAQVMAPAIRLASEGFPVYQVFAELLARDTMRLRRDTAARALLWKDGTLIGIGQQFRNPALAGVLQSVSDKGREGFYSGPVAQALIARLNAGGHPASLQDLADYKPQWKRPLCIVYRDRVILSAPPPQGGLQLLTTMQLLETGTLGDSRYPTQSFAAFDLMASAMRGGMSVSRVNNDDPRWRVIPVGGLLSDAYASTWQSLVGTSKAADSLPYHAPAAANAPAGAACNSYQPYNSAAANGGEKAQGDVESPAGGETTHISVVDAQGNAVAVTVTNSSMFGIGVAVQGYFLNDSGTNPERGALRQARSEWRTRNSTIAPTLVMHGDAVEAVVGSPGGGRIPLAMAQTISYILDFGLDPLEALRMPRLYATGTRRVEIENGFEPAVLASAREAGYIPIPQGFGYARLYLIAKRGNQWVAVADPRHDGQARAY